MMRLLYLSLATMISSAAWGDIIQIGDLTESLSVALVPNGPAVGNISNLVITGETATFTYTLPAGSVFGGNFNSFRDLLDPPGGDDPAGGVSDTFLATWAAGATTASVSFSSDPDTISVGSATQLPSVNEIGGFQPVVAVAPLNLVFQVASDVPEPSALLECIGAFGVIGAQLYRRRRSRL